MSQIGFFQLSNLVRNKVPFALFALDLSEPTYLEEPMSLLMQGARYFESYHFLDELKKMELKLEHPIVLLCQDGKTSEAMVEALTKLGFINVYCVKDGWKNLLKDG